MVIQVIEKGGKHYVEGTAGEKVLLNVDDALELIGFCLERKIRLVMLHAEHLSEEFFDLGSSEAGNILQKFRNFGMKLAVILPQASLQSGKFGEMVAEENRGKHFRAFEDRTMAEEWLISD